MAYIETEDGVEIYFKDVGEGPTILLVHGWPLDADMWEDQIYALSTGGFRVVAYDRRGFGRSEQPFDGYDYDTLSDDLATLIDDLELSDITLVGFSMGGGEVARYMSRHDGKGVSRAILVSAVPPYLLKDESNPDGVDKSVFDGFVDAIKKDRAHFLAGFAKDFYGAGLLNFSVSDELLRWSQSVAMMASLKATVDCVAAFSETDFRPDLKTFKVPTLVIHGSADATVPLEISGQRSAELIPGAELIVYDGAPHGLFFTEKDRLSADIARFARG